MFEQLSKQNKLDKAKKIVSEAEDYDRHFQRLAREEFDFRNGDGQWTAEEKQQLEDQLRPALTFNLSKSSIDLIMGMNEDNKIRHRASPFEPTDAFLCDVINDLDEYTIESNNFEIEEDGALESASICGRGFVGIDFQPDPNKWGEIQLTEVDIPVHEIRLDPASRKTMGEDASHIVWDRWMNQEDFKIRFPKISQKKIDTMIESNPSKPMSTEPLTDDGTPISDPVSADYERLMDNDISYYDRGRSMLRVVHLEYWEYYKKHFVFNPEVGEFEQVPSMPNKVVKEEFFRQFGEEITIETIFDKRVKWLQFIGNEILYDGPSPLPYAGFSIVPVIAFRDASKRTNMHFGIIRLIKDPQREVNKRWSQALNMLNQQVQPGVYAETDAFVDQDQATQSMKIPGEITWVNQGAITGGKIQERNVPTFPNAPMQMEQFSQDIIKKITGINPDLLGQDSGRQEPGVVVRMRQQQGITLLKPLFRNFNHAKKELFKRRIAIMLSYMPDQQILRVLGQNDRYNIDPNTRIVTDTKTGLQADLASVRELEYNVIAEPSNNNLSKRMLELQALLEMQEKVPVPPLQIISKLEISETEKQEWITYIQEQQQQNAEQQKQLQDLEIEFKNREIKVDEQKNVMDFMVDIAKLKQMSEKDEKSMATKFAGMQQQEQAALLQFVANMANVAATANQKSEGEKKNDKGQK